MVMPLELIWNSLKREKPDNYLREYMEGGPHMLDKGYWTDDTSMALAIADALKKPMESLIHTRDGELL